MIWIKHSKFLLFNESTNREASYNLIYTSTTLLNNSCSSRWSIVFTITVSAMGCQLFSASGPTKIPTKVPNKFLSSVVKFVQPKTSIKHQLICNNFLTFKYIQQINLTNFVPARCWQNFLATKISLVQINASDSQHTYQLLLLLHYEICHLGCTADQTL